MQGMKTRILPTLAAVLLIGCSDDETTTPTTEVDSATVEDTGAATETGGDDTSTPTDGTVEETSMMTDGSTMETSTTDAPAGDTRDAADTAPAPKIKCGSSTCDPATKVCCGGVTGGATCADKADAGATCTTKFMCSSSDTCGSGMKCCAVVSTTVSGSECKTSCGMLEIQLCDSSDECAGSVDAAGMCTPLTGTGAATGYSRCN